VGDELMLMEDWEGRAQRPKLCAKQTVALLDL
jgi:hypothetical protein